MSNLLFVLLVSLGSVLLGYIFRKLLPKSSTYSNNRIQIFSKNLKLITMFVLNPVPLISSFWAFSLEKINLLFFPLFGLLCIGCGGIAALIANSIFRIPPKQAASVFTSGMFSNILTFGGLTAFVFFGASGYVLVQLFNMLITPMYYLIGFPMSKMISIGERPRVICSLDMLKERPYFIIPFIAIVIGILLNVIGYERPSVLALVTSFLIPLITGLLGFSIGITLSIGKIKSYCKEIAIVSLIKFFIVPVFMASIGLLVGLPNIMDGIPFKVLIIASSMPVAFNSLIPPAIYGFDLDLANSAWIVTTFSFIVILPVLYFLLNI